MESDVADREFLQSKGVTLHDFGTDDDHGDDVDAGSDDGSGMDENDVAEGVPSPQASTTVANHILSSTPIDTHPQSSTSNTHCRAINKAIDTHCRVIDSHCRAINSH